MSATELDSMLAVVARAKREAKAALIHDLVHDGLVHLHQLANFAARLNGWEFVEKAGDCIHEGEVLSVIIESTSYDEVPIYLASVEGMEGVAYRLDLEDARTDAVKLCDTKGNLS